MVSCNYIFLLCVLTHPRNLHLVVESDFSGGARSVWVDPLLLVAPLADRAVEAEMQAAARDAEVREVNRGNRPEQQITADRDLAAAKVIAAASFAW